MVMAVINGRTGRDSSGIGRTTKGTVRVGLKRLMVVKGRDCGRMINLLNGWPQIPIKMKRSHDFEKIFDVMNSIV